MRSSTVAKFVDNVLKPKQPPRLITVTTEEGGTQERIEKEVESLCLNSLNKQWG